MKKKIIALMLGTVIAVIAALGVGCAKPAPQPEPTPEFEGWTPDNILEKPVTKDDVLISPFFWVADTKVGWSAVDQMERYYNAGFNFMPLASNTPTSGMLTDEEKTYIRRDLTSLAWWKKIDALMKEYNTVYYFTQKAGHFNDREPSTRRDNMFNTDALNDSIEIIPQLDNCIGVFVGDEPSEGLWEEYGLWMRRYNSQIEKNGEAMDLEIYANLLGWANYSKWMQTIKCNPGVLSHDNYCLRDSGNDYNIMSDINAMRRVSNEYDLKLACYIQGDRHWDFRMPNFDEFKWLFNLYLSFGFTEFKYYTYMMYNQDGCTDAVLAMDGTVLHPELHAQLSQLHKELRALGANTDLVNLKAEQVYATGGKRSSGVEELPANWIIEKEGLTDKDLIYSLFTPRKDTSQDGVKYLSIMNNSFDQTVKDLKVYLSDYASITKLEQYNFQTGKFEKVDLGRRMLKLDFEKSETKFFRIYEN